MKQGDTRLRLINGTIHVIARDGLDKATTKSIGEETSINQAYIYRNFADKEDMFARAFDVLDAELADNVMKHLPLLFRQDIERETRCRFAFFAVWEFLLSNRDKCLAYVRYYYSPYFNDYSFDVHKERFMPIVDRFKDAFIDEADVWMILNHILNVMLDFAVKVHNSQMSKDDDYSEHVFRVVYRSVEQYFRKPKENEI